MVGSVLVQRMREERDFDHIEPVFFSTSQAGGSVRREGDTLLVTTRLAEAASGRQVWAHRFQLRVDELPRVQLEIAASVANALAVHIDDEILARARRRPGADASRRLCREPMTAGRPARHAARRCVTRWGVPGQARSIPKY